MPPDTRRAYDEERESKCHVRRVIETTLVESSEVVLSQKPLREWDVMKGAKRFPTDAIFFFPILTCQNHSSWLWKKVPSIPFWTDRIPFFLVAFLSFLFSMSFLFVLDVTNSSAQYRTPCARPPKPLGPPLILESGVAASCCP